ncbi:hypothetical protein OIU77_017081 [Salix suchowensis]|uniref:Xylanase inhibitor C-terminal domain-containing protein n=1 Tax=Salix suchowensis TaxID=1278906 RepID=A0ABQ8ZMV9_9ROSI|nr:hypothetical protein OIU77_017081 [Salix suchowensis]
MVSSFPVLELVFSKAWLKVSLGWPPWAAQMFLPNCFAICLSGSKSQPGVAHFGSRGPYNFLPGIDLSKSLLYTPLISNPFGKDSDPDKPRASPDYYIGLSSIKVNGKMVALNKSLLAIDGETGSGGTKISTVVPYTKLQSSIYKTFITAFLKEAVSSAFNLTTTKPVKPFRACYPASAVKKYVSAVLYYLSARGDALVIHHYDGPLLVSILLPPSLAAIFDRVYIRHMVKAYTLNLGLDDFYAQVTRQGFIGYTSRSGLLLRSPDGDAS